MKLFNSVGLASTVVAIMTGHAGALAAGRADLGANSVAIACTILVGKVLVITNTSGQTIPAGSAITYDGERESGTHYGKTFTTEELVPGATIRRQGSPSASCAAWFTRPILPAPKQ